MADGNASGSFNRYAVVPARAYMDVAMTPALTHVLGAICSHREDQGFAIVRYSIIARDLGLDPRWLRRCVQKLEALGYLRREPRYHEDGSQAANVYFVLQDSLLPLERWRVVPPSVAANADLFTQQGGGSSTPRGEGHQRPGGRVINAQGGGSSTPPLYPVLDTTTTTAAENARARATPSAVASADPGDPAQPWQALAASLMQQGILAPTTNPRALALSLQGMNQPPAECELEACAAQEWNAARGWDLTLSRWRRWLANRKPVTPQNGQTGEPTYAEPTNTHSAPTARQNGSGPVQAGTGETEPAAAGATPPGSDPARSRTGAGGRGYPTGRTGYGTSGKQRHRGPRGGDGITEPTAAEWDAWAEEQQRKNAQQTANGG